MFRGEIPWETLSSAKRWRVAGKTEASMMGCLKVQGGGLLRSRAAGDAGGTEVPHCTPFSQMRGLLLPTGLIGREDNKRMVPRRGAREGKGMGQ